MIRVGNTLQRLRKAQNLSLTAISEETGIQLASLSRIENNQMTGTLDTHVALAGVFGLKLSEYFAEYEQDAQQGAKHRSGSEKPSGRAYKRLKTAILGVLDNQFGVRE